MGRLPHATIRDFLGRVDDLCPDRPGGEAATFEEIGATWVRHGLRPGDLVLLGLPNGLGLLHHFFGVLEAGGVPALIAPGTPSDRLRELVAVMGARAVGMFRMPAAELPDVSRHRVDGLDVALFPAAAPPTCRAGEVVLLTSGTSGFHSGCVFPLESLLLNGGRHARSVGQRADDAVLVNLPLHFSFALVAQALSCLASGSRLIISGPPFHLPSYLRMLAERRVTVSSLTPVLVRSLLHRDEAFPEGLRVLSVGGDSLAAEQVGQLLRRRPGGELYLTYGLTQAGPRVSTLAAHAEPGHRHASVGLPNEGTRVELADLGDRSGRRQLVVASETVMRRRIGRVEGRAGGELVAPGVVLTGDIFDQDGDGYLYYRGRISDYTIRRGEKLCLAAIRRVAGQLPHVISARTTLVRDDQGELDYELTLIADRELDLNACRARLGRMLQRGELPRAINAVVISKASIGYK